MDRAFDSVWHIALLHKLVLRGCNIFLVRIIYSFLTFQVRVGKSKSPVCNIHYGVPQSTVLLQLFRTSSLRMPSLPMSVSLLLSPMTLPYFCPSSDTMAICDVLQDLFYSLTDYFKLWKIKVNSSKPQAIYFNQMLVSTAALKFWDSS
jgi:hypothetical protein